jgi:hypothetical protein
LGTGVHTFAVRAIDVSDNLDPTPASHTWTINLPPDTTPPETIITVHPDPFSENGDAMFEFSGSEPGSSFACALDSTSFNVCVSPVAYVGLGAGTHTFQVYAIDLAGNFDPTPATFTWTVLPQTTLITGPASPTSSRSATFTFLVNESSTLQCSLDGAPFAACASPIQYSGLKAGNHHFAVRAIDPAGNIDPTPVNYFWLIELSADPTPVQATILSGPSALTEDTSATFTFSANESGATFECALDGGVFMPCPSPMLYTGMGLGSHALTVHAVDVDGNIGPATSLTWTIESPPPPPRLLISPIGNGSFALRLEGVPGKTYRLQHAPSLTPSAWTELGRATPDASGLVLFLDTPLPPSSQRFYRSIYP